jgi:hypothetical protein
MSPVAALGAGQREARRDYVRRGRTGRLASCAAVALVALGAPACGGESDAEQISALIGNLQEDFAAERVGAVCAALGERPKIQIGTIGHETRPTTCERDLRKLLGGIDYTAFSRGEPVPDLRRNPKPEVVEVEVSGDSAMAHLSLEGKPLEAPFVKEDGEWKLDDFWIVTGPVRRDLR